MSDVSPTKATIVQPLPAKSDVFIRVKGVLRIVSDRLNAKTEREEYLVLWKSDNANYPPLSWHNVDELQPCLEKVQAYLERITSESAFRKRKSPSDEDRVPPVQPDVAQAQAYNGVINGTYFTQCIPANANQENVVRLNVHNIPPPRVLRTGETREADTAIRIEFSKRLSAVAGPRITISNKIDGTSPSLKFHFIDENHLGKGVYRADVATMTGCDSCSPAMGRRIGCEYTRKCECLEYAAVDEERLTAEQRERYEIIKTSEGGGSTLGLPKRFPYYSTDSNKNGCLITFYLESRSAVYECNPNCRCGPNCKTRIVQHGRKVPLEIFKTANRGWGLRSKKPLLKGQFIDCYLGEIITDAEATRREAKGGKGKDNYLYSLDKFAETENIEQEDVYVIDGEFHGGATRFINHSCEPNCRQYVVSYNKHDPRIYEIAFFAYRDIPAGEELVFDYLDKDDRQEADEEMEPPGSDAVPCRCGAPNCRKYLWT